MQREEKKIAIIQRERKLIQNLKSYSALTGILKSKKMATIIQFESSLERDLAKILEFRHDVVGYIDHPFKISYFRGEKEHTYTPDFLIEFDVTQYKDGVVDFMGIKSDKAKWLIEVKYKDSMNSFIEFDLFKYEQTRKICDENEMFFTFIDESIRGQYLENVSKLMAFRSTPLKRDMYNYVANFFKLRKGKEARIYELIDDYPGEVSVIISGVWSLMYKRYLQCDLSSPVTKNTTVKYVL